MATKITAVHALSQFVQINSYGKCIVLIVFWVMTIIIENPQYVNKRQKSQYMQGQAQLSKFGETEYR